MLWHKIIVLIINWKKKWNIDILFNKQFLIEPKTAKATLCLAPRSVNYPNKFVHPGVKGRQGYGRAKRGRLNWNKFAFQEREAIPMILRPMKKLNTRIIV